MRKHVCGAIGETSAECDGCRLVNAGETLSRYREALEAAGKDLADARALVRELTKSSTRRRVLRRGQQWRVEGPPVLGKGAGLAAPVGQRAGAGDGDEVMPMPPEMQEFRWPKDPVWWVFSVLAIVQLLEAIVESIAAIWSPE